MRLDEKRRDERMHHRTHGVILEIPFFERRLTAEFQMYYLRLRPTARHRSAVQVGVKRGFCKLARACPALSLFSPLCFVHGITGLSLGVILGRRGDDERRVSRCQQHSVCSSSNRGIPPAQAPLKNSQGTEFGARRQTPRRQGALEKRRRKKKGEITMHDPTPRYLTEDFQNDPPRTSGRSPIGDPSRRVTRPSGGKSLFFPWELGVQRTRCGGR